MFGLPLQNVNEVNEYENTSRSKKIYERVRIEYRRSRW